MARILLVALLALLAVAGASAQGNETDGNASDLPDDPAAGDPEMRAAISASAVVVLVVLFVYLARR